MAKKKKNKNKNTHNRHSSRQENSHGQNRRRQAPEPTFREGLNPVAVVIQEGNAIRIRPCDKAHSKFTYDIHPADLNGAKVGDVVAIEEVQLTRRGPRFAVTKKLGHRDDPGIQTLISIHEQGLRTEFSKAALNEVANMKVPELGNREDLRGIPLVTVDPVDARDFDDAVYAEPTDDGGHHLIVAIADVAAYVKSSAAVDEEAFERGNSTYFPDRVLHMIPPSLSTGLCSLKPHEDRACMGFHLWIDKDGQLTGYKPFRGLMKSAARLTYEQLQAAKDGNPDATTKPLLNNVVKPLYAAYEALSKARDARGTLTFEGDERRVLANDNGIIAEVRPYQRVDSHKLIEEFMILANVAAAKALEDKGFPCVYRVHEAPPDERNVQRLKELLDSVGIKANRLVTAADFNEVLKKAEGHPEYPMISLAVLRTQAKAAYSTNNVGHFGLALDEYAHFTSPIRRDADLWVHRALITAYGLGEGGLTQEEMQYLESISEHISQTEIRSANAERDSKDRLTAKFLEASIGQTFKGRVQNVTKAGMFVRLEGTGADGLVPMKYLSQGTGDYFDFDEDKLTLNGRNSGAVYRAGMEIEVRLKDADGLSGRITLQPANDNNRPAPRVHNAPTGPSL